MTSLSNKLKQHAKAAGNMSPIDITKGVWNIASNTVKYSLQAVGATVYVADKSIRAVGSIGKHVYDEAKDGYHKTDELVTSTQPEAPKPMATKRQPQQMEFDFE